MAYSKISFHMGTPCNGCTGMGEMWRRLNEAGVPFGVYSVDNGGIVGADGLRYGQAKWLIYRDTSFDYVPYHAAATPEAGRNLWAQAEAALPAEVKANKSRIWVEMFNEPSKEESGATTTEMVAAWQYHTAQAALAAGYKFCGPGWAGGTPEPTAWRRPWMRKYLELCAAKPEQVAVTLHEYSYNEFSIMAGYPYQVGRFLALFGACDEMGIARPTTMITELGWTLDNMPEPSRAMEDVNTVAALYAGHPQIKAAFLWSLIGGGDKVALAQKLNGLIEPVATYTLNVRWPDPPAPPPPPTEGAMTIVDVSHHQGVINWDVLARRVIGAVIRVGDGLGEDVQFRRNVAEAKRTGVPFLTYHYWRPTRDPLAQAEFAAGLVKALGAPPLIAADFEEKEGTDAATPVKARVYLDRLEALLGVPPMIYTSPGYWRGWMKSPAWGSRHRLWLAHWGVPTPDVPTPWTTWTLWQYEVKSIANERAAWGIPAYGAGALDIDRVNGNANTWKALVATAPALVDVAAVIRADAAAVPGWNPTFGFPRAMLADGLHPLPGERTVTTGGKQYVYQVAQAGDGKRRIYYAPLPWGSGQIVEIEA